MTVEIFALTGHARKITDPYGRLERMRLTPGSEGYQKDSILTTIDPLEGTEVCDWLYSQKRAFDAGVLGASRLCSQEGIFLWFPGRPMTGHAVTIAGKKMSSLEILRNPHLSIEIWGTPILWRVQVRATRKRR